MRRRERATVLAAEKATLTAELAALNATVAGLSERVAALRADVASYHGYVKAALAEAGEILRLEKANAELRQKNGALRDEVLSLNAALLAVPGSGIAAGAPAAPAPSEVTSATGTGTTAPKRARRTARDAAKEGEG